MSNEKQHSTKHTSKCFNESTENSHFNFSISSKKKFFHLYKRKTSKQRNTSNKFPKKQKNSNLKSENHHKTHRLVGIKTFKPFNNFHFFFISQLEKNPHCWNNFPFKKDTKKWEEKSFVFVFITQFQIIFFNTAKERWKI